MAQFSFKVGPAPHYIPQITCKPFAFEGTPVLKVAAPARAPAAPAVKAKKTPKGK
jgi:hypothetical protein